MITSDETIELQDFLSKVGAKAVNEDIANDQISFKYQGQGYLLEIFDKARMTLVPLEANDELLFSEDIKASLEEVAALVTLGMDYSPICYYVKCNSSDPLKVVPTIEWCCFEPEERLIDIMADGDEGFNIEIESYLDNSSKLMFVRKTF